MIEDFRIAIGAAWQVKQQMMELDKRNIWPYHLPALAAVDEQIQKAERYLGFSLDSRYKAFLKCADGWPAFYQSVDLFGTGDLIEGLRKDNAESMLSFLDDSALEKSGVERSKLFPIAATALDRDLFVMTVPSSSFAGMVIWFAGEEVDRFATFDDYFLAMLEYNRRNLDSLKRHYDKV